MKKYYSVNSGRLPKKIAEDFFVSITNSEVFDSDGDFFLYRDDTYHYYVRGHIFSPTSALEARKQFKEYVKLYKEV